jgi:homospermidine synthase
MSGWTRYGGRSSKFDKGVDQDDPLQFKNGW